MQSRLGLRVTVRVLPRPFTHCKALRIPSTLAPGRVFIGRRDLVDITGTADGEVTLNGHPATPVENVAEQRYPNEPADLRSP